LADRQAELLPVPYFHVVFTLPAPIAAIAFHNKAALYAMLFKTALEAMTALAADPRRLGARIGGLAIPHTWGQASRRRPHVHCVVPGGGLSPDGARWIEGRANFFLAVKPLSRLFRRLFLERLQAAFDGNDLGFFGDLAHLASPAAFAAHLAAVRRVDCRVDGDVAVPIPHRPGRAEFPHPVLHERDSLAAAYPWAILAGGRGWRFRISLRRVHLTTLWRSRRDNHFCHIRTT
jgi:hypothetical protein